MHSSPQTPPPQEVLTGTVAVLLPLPLKGAYDYSVGDRPVAPGSFVVVPLGKREQLGVVWGQAKGDTNPAKLKSISRVLDVSPLPEVTRKFIDWVASYTLSAPGAVLRMAMSVSSVFEPTRPQMGWRVAQHLPEFKQTPARQRVLEVASKALLSTSDLASEAGVSSAVVRGLADQFVLVPTALPRAAMFEQPRLDLPAPTLSEHQSHAAKALSGAVGAGFSVKVLDGVTGSGKTEVYFEAVAAALKNNQQVLVLLPEIALSAQWLGRFKKRFGVEPAQWHSELTDAKRRETWREVASNQAKVVVGARSGLFLPYADLGLIIVDEEHDGAFKQEEGVTYHARDMAVVRGHLGKIPVVLASATPSLETLANVEAGRYDLLSLPNRHAGAVLPDIIPIDLRKTPPTRGFWLAEPLVEALTKTLEAGEQAMLFLNRRGYAPLTLCRTCGHRMQCPHCTAWLVEHRHQGRMSCHHCGFTTRPPEQCPQCEEADSFVACGPGVERIAEEAQHRFPKAKVGVMASDTLAGPQAAAEFVRRVSEREVDILVGTQIVAKGYHFPLLTLVGVVDADLGLAGGDLRAAERTHQLLSQVAGRAGRGEKPGTVYLQTYMPENSVINALIKGERDEFMNMECDSRRVLGMPPFGRLAALVLSGPDADQLDKFCSQMARSIPSASGVEVLGPVEAPLALLRGKHRRRFLVKTPKQFPLQSWLKSWVFGQNIPSVIRVHIDIDPYSFL